MSTYTELRYGDDSLLEKLYQYYRLETNRVYRDPVDQRAKAYAKAKRELREYDAEADRERTFRNLLAWSN